MSSYITNLISQVSHNNVMTCADGMGVVIDRHHGVEVTRLAHDDVTVCLANPHNPSMLVTGGEDGALHVWK